MSRAVEIFRMNAEENRRLENEAADSRSKSERDRDRHARDQAHHAEALEQATKGLGDGLRHLAGETSSSAWRRHSRLTLNRYERISIRQRRR